ncbi:hypothetical protein SDC9_206480 [bioreactor metagenome]|uniref:Uncharacterized protein n=1 Tax=bioreactor metagenome TaxID=1076179 RepID=A0A645J5V1_9ZZZZ
MVRQQQLEHQVAVPLMVFHFWPLVGIDNILQHQRMDSKEFAKLPHHTDIMNATDINPVGRITQTMMKKVRDFIKAGFDNLVFIIFN